MQFAGICLNTEDVRRLAAFYSALFGIPASGDETHSELALPGLNLAIFSRHGMEEMAPGSMRGCAGGSVTLMFQVDDADAEFLRLQALDGTVILPPTTHPWGARSFWFLDPDGNIVDFFARV